uniref:PIN domain-containing protein n=1 Tax=Thermofilum pendens TaxID=2269 RepID=A0A7J3X6R0_THEPE
MLKVLLDTSFLLPAFGVDAGEEVLGCLKLIAARRERVRAYYSPYSLLEAVMVLLREAKQGRLGLEEAVGMAREGAVRVIYGLEVADTLPEAYLLAVKLYSLGHRDLFDNLLYATAATGGLPLLTLDSELLDFLEKVSLPRAAIGPGDLREKLP